ncbi:M48 family metallopeptidase [Desulfogranum japonicum]|uniref:M48 family metallopeptidase n=1 Tax=Desulfogranum japonicum TaxID=231447 RepID=UPI00041A65EC|nr:M48 family metallopeptidase [Desulfogranum japonicum]
MAINTEEEFINLVKKAEKEAETNSKAYAAKVALFALFGYLVILLVFVVLLGLGAGLVAAAFFSTALFFLLIKKKLIFIVASGIWVLFQALWVKITPPDGYSLQRKEFPELFAELDALSSQLKSLKIHEVILDNNLNASVLQHPRLGVLGWNKNYLILGYQLLLTLSPEEMRSVLAHEFGHLSGNHSRFNGWIYRVRLSWLRVMAAFDQAESWGGMLMGRFFDWYSPRFEAYSFALARSNEYEADSIASELTSPEIATRALVNVYATAPYLDQRYWDIYLHYADEHAQPPYAPFEGLIRFLKDNPLSKEDMLVRIKEEMTLKTHYADTHPCLHDRVAALGASPQLPVPSETSAAEAWLGEGNKKIREDFDQEWIRNNLDSWKERYEYVVNAQTRLAEFAQAQPVDLCDDDLWSYACWTDEFVSGKTALPLFRIFQERYPEDPYPAFFIGVALLEQGDDAGLEHLRLASKSVQLIERVAHAGYDFLKQNDRGEEAEAWWQMALEQNKIFIAAQQERETITCEDELEHPQIDNELLQQLIANLKKQKKVGKVWLAQKTVQYFPESPVYIIAFAAKGFLFSLHGIQQKVAEKLDVEGDFFVVCRAGETRKFAKRVAKTGKRII